MGEFDWDKGLDYAETREKLKGLMGSVRPEAAEDLIPKKCLTQYAILSTQLANAARISEAFDGVRVWAETGNRRPEVQVRKRGKMRKCLVCGGVYSMKSKEHGPKKHTETSGHEKFSEPFDKPELRMIVLPPECLETDRLYLKEAFKRGVTIASTKIFVRRHLGFNTHSLRYAQISHLVKEGTPIEIVAKMTHHATTAQILHYTQQKTADEELIKAVEGS